MSNTLPAIHEEDKPRALEILLRQRDFWFNEGTPESAALIAARHQQVADLKADLGVTDEAEFLRALQGLNTGASN